MEPLSTTTHSTYSLNDGAASSSKNRLEVVDFILPSNVVLKSVTFVGTLNETLLVTCLASFCHDSPPG